MESIKDILKGLSEKKDESKSQKELFDTEKYSKKSVLINDKHKYISKEYQYYGLHLAGKLGDTKRVTMYIKWAKEKPRHILERAYSFAIDYPSAKDRSRIFIWKVKQLEEEMKAKE
ncbi:hypothetical protein A3K02_01660 [candidate division WS6 bacterium RIFOXYD1_FULL_33_8]|uniref:Uncharacterized protein n=2 Tax=Candidatus Dojkabacteria TaxID=74243 RepID=A0A0G0AD72_9BACT|nr:MAG: hypothetical protein UR32_C0016G0021 [candidate division WS6 bacterium GW2011_GWE2_33_157]KKP44522.1 MAG: hypothetical protein UR34_C0002G0025 [candidate division WS6 bacterium GW2011_GWC1_33_20]KKP44629.1 MAG: hypothetical protein UR36_C0015G0004 [candidate division WS6 bacterium GW2011_GWF1_33_233]KKP54262.1 MAG: hypothetical protein UR45_C0020G0002 [candidate division WS6 bacterium GW2011_WS6_33_547]KKP54533.1 MAG: hypothetical protein UR47_C0015G0013 [candidate division WS6 bacteriu